MNKKMNLQFETHEPLYRQVWNHCIGRQIGETLCVSCECSIITMITFHCGYIVSPANGGRLEINNLMPLCHHCYRCLGNINMIDFMRDNCLPGYKLFNTIEQSNEPAEIIIDCHSLIPEEDV